MFPDSRTGSRLRAPAGAFAGELLELQDQQGGCTSKIDIGLAILVRPSCIMFIWRVSPADRERVGIGLAAPRSNIRRMPWH